jgi:hypothetical protein
LRDRRRRGPRQPLSGGYRAAGRRGAFQQLSSG